MQSHHNVELNLCYCFIYLHIIIWTSLLLSQHIIHRDYALTMVKVSLSLLKTRLLLHFDEPVASQVARWENVSLRLLSPISIGLDCQRHMHNYPSSLHLRSLLLFLWAYAARAVDGDDTS